MSIVDTDTNADLVEPFWVRLGYKPTGEAVAYVSGSAESTARIWVRPVVVAQMFRKERTAVDFRFNV